MNNKLYLTSIFILICSLLSAQNFEDTWTGYFSYGSVKAITQGNDKVFAAAENSVFSFDLSTQEFETISTINGLSGDLISSIYYSENFNLLIIGYANGLVEIVIDGDEDILTIVDILDKPSIPPDEKRINHFNEFDGILYIATDFGISEYDLAALEFGDTFIIGDLGTRLSISQTAVQPPYIYASSSVGGIRRALIENDDLIDFEEWTTITSGNYSAIQSLASEVYTVNATNNSVVRINATPTFTTVANYNTTTIRDFGVKDDILTITTRINVRAYSQGFIQIAEVTNNSFPEFDFRLQAGYSFNNTFYLGTFEMGMLAIPFSSNNAQQILPDGPVRNDPFTIDAAPGQLWVGYGEVTVSYNPYPKERRGLSNLKEGMWTNFTYEELQAKVNNSDFNDIVEVTINPENPDEVYVSSFLEGMLKITDQEDFTLYNNANGPLTDTNNDPAVGIRIYGSAFDRNGNLWFGQTKEEDGLIKLSPNGQFQKFDVTDAVPDPIDENALTEFAVSREGYIFFGSYGNGLIGYNPSTNMFNKIQEDIGSGNLPNNTVRTIAFDSQNRLWIGTLKGLRVLFNVGGFFEEGANIESQAIIILDGDVAQELLFEQSISDIEVDGSNNKWISTATSGVFYLSPNGQETLLRFTKENSPLPSNNVQDIAIDDFTGVVYFATTNGLVAFNGTATGPRDNLNDVYAFPNPVRPGFTGNVTIDGLTANANVKITDIEGNLVFETTSAGGSVLWDTSAFGKYKVRSGVYLVLVTTEDATETTISKIMVVR